ncbi:MAG: hypothetical protein ACHQT9_04975, partial [Candidatus Saccharimonadales bacterium]
GRPVTVEGLKDVVDRADIKGAAKRANSTFAGPVNTIFRIILKIIGLVFILSGLSVMFGIVAAGTYVLLHSGSPFQDNIFPVGLQERLLLSIAMSVISIAALFIVVFGVAIFRRKWPIHTWVTGILVGLLFIGLAVGGALGADVYPNIRDRYNSNVHSTVRSVQPFTAINLDNANNVNIDFQPSSKYYVSFNYYDHPNLGSIKTYVKGGTLFIDSNQFNPHRSCNAICIPITYNMDITVYTPSALQIENQDGPIPVNIPIKPYQP